MKTIEVVAAIIKDNNKILIAKRNYGEFENMWEFPGGKVEENEDNKTALKREIMEELEININVLDYFMTAEYDYPSFHLSMDCYICSLIDNNIHLSAHSDYKWIDINDDNIDINWIPADIQIINKLKEAYSK